jgi:bacterioferritin-associated ferredoxin
MYVCLCKGLTDGDIREMARTLHESGIRSVGTFLALLDLEAIEACGLCAQEPDQIVGLAMSEWAEIDRGEVERGEGPDSP